MKCPKCGKELEDGKLLCEFCGEEVKIVPLFDAEVESQIDETLGDIVKNLIMQDDEDILEDEEEKSDMETGYLPVAALWKSIVVCALGLLFAIGIIGAAFMNISKKNHDNSFNYQYQTAMNYVSEGAYDQAIRYLEHALAIEPDNLDARYQLGVLYLKVDQYHTGMKVLYELLSLDMGEKEKVYDTLLSNLLSKMDYSEIANLLQDCPYDSLVQKYYSYTAFVPQFSDTEVVHDKPLELSLTSENEGIIYYTLDGSKPTTNSQVYDSVLYLESGDYTINAMFVNMYGCASDIVTKSYYINLALPPDPEISVDTGVYHEPTMIEIYHDKTTKIYYTLDGSIPTDNSLRYTEPLEMLYGTCNMAFIAINDKGLCSNVVRRTFQLNVETPISAELAIGILKNHLIVNGIISDVDGHLDNKTGYNTYSMHTVIMDHEQEYFIIKEAYVDEFGIIESTNNLYAINCMDGSACKARKIAEGKYFFTNF